MRIPSTAEFLAFFVATGRFSSPSMQDTELPLLGAPACDAWYTVEAGDICDTIAAAHKVPTFQIICENDQINGQCTNLVPNQRICLGRKAENCHASNTGVVQWPDTSPEKIAKQHGIPVDVFEDNNYCYDTLHGKRLCQQFHNGQVVCVAKTRLELSECPKIF